MQPITVILLKRDTQLNHVVHAVTCTHLSMCDEMNNTATTNNQL